MERQTLTTGEAPSGPSRRGPAKDGLLVGLGTAVAGMAAPVLTGTDTVWAAAPGTESANYSLWCGDIGGGGYQANWAWCDKCMGFYQLFQGSSVCPKDGNNHDGSESADYVMP
jgi:hypothetical protein